jgi:SAM-dependent methyltransferase
MKSIKNTNLYSKEYYQEFENGFKSTGREDHKRIVELSKFKKNNKVLEIGCGYGVLLNKIKSLDKTGIETNKYAVNYCQKNKLNVILDKKIEKRIKFNSNTFDFIIMNEVIEHFHNPNAVLKECHRILKTKGKIVITTPIKSIFNQHLSPTHFSEMNIKEMEDILKKNNFKINTLEVNGISFINLLLRTFIYQPAQFIRKNKKLKLNKFVNKTQNKYDNLFFNKLMSKYRSNFLNLGSGQLIIAQKI